MEIRKATLLDLTEIRKFTDFWLSGRGLKQNAPGATNDCFISPSQHEKYILKYQTFLITIDNKIVAWAVIQYDNSLIHLLVAGTHRQKGIGKTLLNTLKPKFIHSKSNQQSGNPAPFYKKNGYKKIESRQSKSRFDINKIRPNRKKIIDIFQRTT